MTNKSIDRNATFSEQRHEPFQWEALTFELKHEVLVHLYSIQDLCALATTSKSMQDFTGATWQWRNKFLELYPGLLPILKSSYSRRWRSLTRMLSSSPQAWQVLHKELNTGRGFQAQVHNRELDNSSEDFMHSCYDATVRYQGQCPITAQPLFVAQYLPMCKERVEERNITLNRLRPVPESTHPHRVHPWSVSAVREGEGVEVQWRGDEGHPFGWWFGVVRRVLRSSVVIEFPQYPHHSPWRSVLVPMSRDKGGVVNVDHRWGLLGGLRQLSEGERAEWGEAVRLMAASGDTAAVVGGEGEAAPVGMMAMLVQAVVTAEAVGVELDIAQLAAWVRANHVQAVLAVQVGDEAEHDDELGLEQAEEGEQEQDGQEQGHDHDWQLEEVEEVDAAL